MREIVFVDGEGGAGEYDGLFVGEKVLTEKGCDVDG